MIDRWLLTAIEQTVIVYVDCGGPSALKLCPADNLSWTGKVHDNALRVGVCVTVHDMNNHRGWSRNGAIGFTLMVNEIICLNRTEYSTNSRILNLQTYTES